MGTFLSCQLHWSPDTPYQLDTQEWDQHNQNVLLHFASIMHSLYNIQESYDELSAIIEPPIRFTTCITPKQIQETDFYSIQVVTEGGIRHVCTIRNLVSLMQHLETAQKLSLQVRELRSMIQENTNIFMIDVSVVSSIIEQQDTKLGQFAKQLDLLLFSRWQQPMVNTLRRVASPKEEPVLPPSPTEQKLKTDDLRVSLKKSPKVIERKASHRFLDERKSSFTSSIVSSPTSKSEIDLQNYRIPTKKKRKKKESQPQKIDTSYSFLLLKPKKKKKKKTTKKKISDDEQQAIDEVNKQDSSDEEETHPTDLPSHCMFVFTYLRLDPVSPLVAHINRMVKVLKHFVTDERMENINTVILAISYLIDLDLDDGTFVTSI